MSSTNKDATDPKSAFEIARSHWSRDNDWYLSGYDAETEDGTLKHLQSFASDFSTDSAKHTEHPGLPFVNARAREDRFRYRQIGSLVGTCFVLDQSARLRSKQVKVPQQSKDTLRQGSAAIKNQWQRFDEQVKASGKEGTEALLTDTQSLTQAYLLASAVSSLASSCYSIGSTVSGWTKLKAVYSDDEGQAADGTSPEDAE